MGKTENLLFQIERFTKYFGKNTFGMLMKRNVFMKIASGIA